MTSERNGVLYQCSKRAGHEEDPRDAEHVAIPAEYAYRPVDWRALAEDIVPVVEYVAATSSNMVHRERAQRWLVRYYIAKTNHPTVRKSRPPPAP